MVFICILYHEYLYNKIKEKKSLLLVGLNFSVERSRQVYCTVVRNVMLNNQFLIRNLSEDVSEKFK